MINRSTKKTYKQNFVPCVDEVLINPGSGDTGVATHRYQWIRDSFVTGYFTGSYQRYLENVCFTGFITYLIFLLYKHG